MVNSCLLRCSVRRIHRYCSHLRDLSLERWQQFHPSIDADLFEALAPRQVVAARLSEGGTGFERVEEQLALWSDRLELANH